MFKAQTEDGEVPVWDMKDIAAEFLARKPGIVLTDRNQEDAWNENGE